MELKFKSKLVDFTKCLEERKEEIFKFDTFEKFNEFFYKEISRKDSYLGQFLIYNIKNNKLFEFPLTSDYRRNIYKIIMENKNIEVFSSEKDWYKMCLFFHEEEYFENKEIIQLLKKYTASNKSVEKINMNEVYNYCKKNSGGLFKGLNFPKNLNKENNNIVKFVLEKAEKEKKLTSFSYWALNIFNCQDEISKDIIEQLKLFIPKELRRVFNCKNHLNFILLKETPQGFNILLDKKNSIYCKEGLYFFSRKGALPNNFSDYGSFSDLKKVLQENGYKWGYNFKKIFIILMIVLGSLGILTYTILKIIFFLGGV